MTTPNIEELITYLRSFFIDENVSAIKANQIANALQSQAERIKELEAENGKLSDLWSAMKAKRDTLRAELNTTEVLLEECKMDWSGDVTQIKAEHKHVIDQRKAELPVLPDPAVTNDDLKEMESKVDYWREQHADLGLKYDNILQAFHIAETDVKLWKGTAKKARVEALEEAKLVAKTTCHHESTEFANGFNMAALNIESAIEALKGK